MERSGRTHASRRGTVGKIALLVMVSFGSLIATCAPGQTRTATTSIGITVQRHSAILLPADSIGAARLSTGAERSEGPAAVGNAAPTLITVDDSRSLSPVSSARAHVAVTVFEP